MVEVEWTADRIKALREATRRSRTEFARMVGVSKRTLVLWESGQTANMHAASRRLLHQVLAEADADTVSRFHWALGRVQSVPAANEVGSPILQSSTHSGVDPLRSSADQSAALLNWAEASNVGPLTLKDMREDLCAASRAYLREPTKPVFERTITIRDRAVELLHGRQHPSHSRQLYGVAGWAMTILGWITIDLGRPDTADKHLRTAWALADNADDDDLRAWVRASQHTAAFWREDYGDAAEYAEDGLRYARNGTAALFLASALALDLARAQSQREASSARDRAVDIGAELAESPQRDEFGGPFSCSVERAGGFWADTSLAQTNPARSLEFASAAVDAYTRTPLDRRNLGSERMVRCQQIKDHVALGNRDVAAEELSLVAAVTPPDHRVGPLVQRFDEIACMARDIAGNGSRGVAEIADSAAEFRRNSESGSLPVLTDVVR